MRADGSYSPRFRAMVIQSARLPERGFFGRERGRERVFSRSFRRKDFAIGMSVSWIRSFARLFPRGPSAGPEKTILGAFEIHFVTWQIILTFASVFIYHP